MKFNSKDLRALEWNIDLNSYDRIGAKVSDPISLVHSFDGCIFRFFLNRAEIVHLNDDDTRQMATHLPVAHFVDTFLSIVSFFSFFPPIFAFV